MQTKFPHIFAINIDELQAVKRDGGHKWGYEVWLVNDDKHDTCCKLLIIYPGWLSSKHKHITKWEHFQVLSGELNLHIWDIDDVDSQEPECIIKMESGAQHYIPFNTYHRFETATKQFVLLLEVSGYENEETVKAEPSKEIY